LQSLLLSAPALQNVSSIPWNMIFTLGQQEIEGGIIKLRDVYISSLNTQYQ
jgi:hypothetical protein